MEDDAEGRYQALQREVEEIARKLLDRRPPGTRLIDVWEEALTVQHRRYIRQEKR